ncbi:hypothetical protein ABPG73_022998, partial [Tetrahymena malaccensis]
MIGNKAYMAPEIITKNDNENKIYSKKSDSYSVGLLLSLLDNYLILNGKAPFVFINLTYFNKSFQKQKINIKENTEIFKFVKLLVVMDRASRASLSDIVESDNKLFVTKSKDMQKISKYPQKQKQQVKKMYHFVMKCLHKIEQQKMLFIYPLNKKQGIKQIKITTLKDLHKIKDFQIVEINLR